jgi:hypothetical protein
MLWVLTAEPYHDNSTVLGVFDDQGKAVASLLAAPALPPVDELDDPNYFTLASWDNNGKLRKQVCIFTTSYDLPIGVPLHDTGRDKWVPVDLQSFEW